MEKIQNPGAQIPFVLNKQENIFTLPDTDFIFLPETQYFLNWVLTRPLLQTESHQPALFVDFRHEQTAIYKNGALIPSSNEQAKQTKGRFSSILIVSDSLNEEAIILFGQRLKKAAGFLPRYQGSIFILEIKGENTDKKLRKKNLTKAGFAKANILTPKNQPYLLWEGRKPKERPGIDLTKNPDFWETLRLVINNYQTAGFEPIILKPNSASSIKLSDILSRLQTGLKENKQIDFPLPEIIKLCQLVKNPLQAVTNLINGFGLTVVRTNCGECIWEIDSRGTEIKIRQCDSPHDHPQQPLDATKPKYDYTVGLINNSGIACFDCSNFYEKDGVDYIIGPELIIKTTVLKKGLFRSEICTETHCSRCDYYIKQTKRVLNARIRF